VAVHEVIAELAVEAQEIDQLVAELEPERWAAPTPAPTWTIAHQIAHLTAMFQLTGLSAANPDAFVGLTSQLSDDFDANVHYALSQFLNDDPEVMLSTYRSERDGALKHFAALPPEEPIPWLVQPVPVSVMAGVCLMELFGHGQDIADTLGVRRERTARVRHVAEFGVRAWDFGYAAHGLTPPNVRFRFDLTGPSGEEWTFGDGDAEQTISGDAVDFCMLVTRRRHRDDLNLTASGQEADAWIDLALAYRGPAGQGRVPGQFAGLDG
jgi:enediyne biosynthesis protein E11